VSQKTVRVSQRIDERREVCQLRWLKRFLLLSPSPFLSFNHITSPLSIPKLAHHDKHWSIVIKLVFFTNDSDVRRIRYHLGIVADLEDSPNV
jgi:hypothetical protein